MGRSAKVHKRTPKKTKSSTAGGSSAVAGGSTPSQSQAQTAKKKAGLKDKTAKGKSAARGEGGVLGGADYVSLMMGGRRKAKEEAGKLPREEKS